MVIAIVAATNINAMMIDSGVKALNMLTAPTDRRAKSATNSTTSDSIARVVGCVGVRNFSRPEKFMPRPKFTKIHAKNVPVHE